MAADGSIKILSGLHIDGTIFSAWCYCGWKFSHTNSENLLKWLKITLPALTGWHYKS